MMGEANSHIPTSDSKPPAAAFRITFLPMDVTVTVDPKDVPLGREGMAGSILDIALAHGVEIDHACGGVCACATCHVHVKKGLGSLAEPGEAEEDQLDNAPDLQPTSRLACRAVPDGTADMVVEIPDWNRNLARETP